MKKKRLLITILSLLIFFGCVGYIWHYYYTVGRDENEMSYIQDMVHEEEKESQPESDEPAAEENQEEEIVEYAENGMISKYYGLYQKNNDLTGWIRIPGTNIDYPVMYRNTDNDYYLKRGFNQEKNASGMIFMDYECDFNSSDNLILYGHNMRTGTMFAQLLKYKDKKFFEQNSYIRLDSLYKTGQYKVIGVIYATKKANFDYYRFVRAQNEEEFNAYVEDVKRLSIYDTGETAVYGDKLLTLSTCSYNTRDERFVVVAKKTE